MSGDLPAGRIPESLLQAVRDRINLSDFVGAHVTLRRNGREWTGLCPFHQEKSPSFSVNNAKGIYKCFGCGTGGDVIDFAQRIYRLSFKDAVAALASQTGLDGMTATIDPVVIERAERRQREEEARRRRYTDAALRIWNETVPAEGTPVQVYLQSRGITGQIPPALRFHPELRYKTGNNSFTYFPAMVAAITNADGETVAIHRTLIRRDGTGKAEVARPKTVLGSTRGGAVYLGRIGDTINVTEGIETGLSLQEMTGVTTLAAGSTGGIIALELPPLPLAAYVTIGADNDANNAGLDAAKAAATRWREDGRRVRITKPRDLKDYNDVLRAKRPQGMEP